MALVLAALACAACKPPPAVGLREAGDDRFRASDFAGAATEYQKSLALDPKQEIVWERLAFCRLRTGEKALAVEALARVAALKVTPAQKAEAFRTAAGVWLQTDEREKAVPLLLEAVRLEPADETSLNWLGEIASEKGGARLAMATAVPEELEKAIGWYDRILALRPDARAPQANRRIAAAMGLGHFK
jgi:tetratricopeptide (TPR) repeat protein